MLTVFENGKLFWEGEFRQDKDLILQDGIIAGVAPAGEVTGDKKIPAEGLMILPGLIDLQINGCGGVTYNDSPCIDTLEKMRLTQLRSGTTTFMPTLVTCKKCGNIINYTVPPQYPAFILKDLLSVLKNPESMIKDLFAT